MNDDDLIRQLQELPREVDPPPAVRHAVAEAARRSTARSRTPIWQLAAAAALLVGAFLLGRLTAPRSPVVPAQHEFVLLLYGGEPAGTPDDRVKEYAAWALKMRNEGRRISGERLSDESWTVGADPASSALRGFFIVQARDQQDARALAEAHPHARYGGTVVIRAVAPSP